jgi:hypothetical protein
MGRRDAIIKITSRLVQPPSSSLKRFHGIRLPSADPAKLVAPREEVAHPGEEFRIGIAPFAEFSLEDGQVALESTLPVLGHERLVSFPAAAAAVRLLRPSRQLGGVRLVDEIGDPVAQNPDLTNLQRREGPPAGPCPGDDVVNVPFAQEEEIFQGPKIVRGKQGLGVVVEVETVRQDDHVAPELDAGSGAADGVDIGDGDFVRGGGLLGFHRDAAVGSMGPRPSYGRSYLLSVTTPVVARAPIAPVATSTTPAIARAVAPLRGRRARSGGFGIARFRLVLGHHRLLLILDFLVISRRPGQHIHGLGHERHRRWALAAPLEVLGGGSSEESHLGTS